MSDARPGRQTQLCDESPQCEAIADSTGERCQRDAMEAIPYCGVHKHLLDVVDLRRMGLKRPKSDG